MIPSIKTYKEYEQYVNQEWSVGAINELEQEGLVIFETVDEYGNESYRTLSEEEFAEKYKP